MRRLDMKRLSDTASFTIVTGCLYFEAIISVSERRAAASMWLISMKCLMQSEMLYKKIAMQKAAGGLREGYERSGWLIEKLTNPHRSLSGQWLTAILNVWLTQKRSSLIFREVPSSREAELEEEV